MNQKPVERKRDKYDRSLEGVNARVDEMEDDIQSVKTSLGKLVNLTQRIQWTFTGLAIYYIIENNEALKILLKLV